MKITTEDQIVQKVIKKLDERSNVGYKKYGVTLHDDEPSLHKWLNIYKKNYQMRVTILKS